MDKEQAAIERLKTASKMSLAVYGLPLVVTTSGGKDSSVCVALAKRAGIPFEVMHWLTTVAQAIILNNDNDDRRRQTTQKTQTIRSERKNRRKTTGL